MRVKSALLVAVLASMLAGCWLQPGADAHRDGANPVPVGITASNVATLQPAWSHSLSASGALDPITSQNRVEVTDGVSAFSLDLATGNEAWHHTIAVPPNQDPYSYVTAVTGISSLGVTDLADPAQSWGTFAAGYPTSAAVARDRFVVGLGDTLAAYPTAHQTCPEPNPNVPVCSPTWTATLNGTARTPVLSADEQTVFTSTSTGWVYAIDTNTGATRWSGSVNATAPIALGPNFLSVVSAASSSPRWTRPVAARRSARRPGSPR
jgi:outer membrane protein assembly factor BamB